MPTARAVMMSVLVTAVSVLASPRRAEARSCDAWAAFAETGQGWVKVTMLGRRRKLVPVVSRFQSPVQRAALITLVADAYGLKVA